MILGSMRAFYDYAFGVVLGLGLVGLRSGFIGFLGLLIVCCGFFTFAIIATAG